MSQNRKNITIIIETIVIIAFILYIVLGYSKIKISKENTNNNIVETNMKINSDIIEKREYIKTYSVIEKLDITNEIGTCNYYVIKQFQDDEPVLIKVPNTYNLEKDKNYEFVLYGSKIKDKKYTQNEIFDNLEIKNIIETDKIGLEQIQEL